MKLNKLISKVKDLSFNRLVRNIKDATNKRARRFFWQRRTRGWDDSETWSMDGTFAKLILPRLKRFKEVNCAHPCDLTAEEWDERLQLMIEAFEFYAGEDRFDGKSEDFEKAQVGLDLFAKHYAGLWW